MSVLVNLFSSLRKQGDHSHISVVAQIQALVIEWWQRLFQRAPSNQNVLVTLFRLNGRGRSFKAMPSFIRYSVAHCGVQGKVACSLSITWHYATVAPVTFSVLRRCCTCALSRFTAFGKCPVLRLLAQCTCHASDWFSVSVRVSLPSFTP